MWVIYSVQHYLLAVDDVSSLCTVCVETKQPDFNCRIFSLILAIDTVQNYFARE